MCGGYSQQASPVTPEVKALVLKHKPDVEAQLGATFDQFEPVEYTQQVVSGTNYRVKVQTGADQYHQVVVFQALDCNGGETKLVDALAL